MAERLCGVSKNRDPLNPLQPYWKTADIHHQSRKQNKHNYNKGSDDLADLDCRYGSANRHAKGYCTSNMRVKDGQKGEKLTCRYLKTDQPVRQDYDDRVADQNQRKSCRYGSEKGSIGTIPVINTRLC